MPSDPPSLACLHAYACIHSYTSDIHIKHLLKILATGLQSLGEGIGVTCTIIYQNQTSNKAKKLRKTIQPYSDYLDTI